MKISLRHIGSYGGRPSEIIEMTFENGNSSITEDITEWKTGLVDMSIIDNLKQVVEELEEQNDRVSNIL